MDALLYAIHFMNKGASEDLPNVGLNRVDLNLLVYLDALLRERNVTRGS